MSTIDAELRHLAAPPLPGRDGAALPPDQPDPHEQAEDYELQLPYQPKTAYPVDEPGRRKTVTQRGHRPGTRLYACRAQVRAYDHCRRAP
jgi:hypothetical protein